MQCLRLSAANEVVVCENATVFPEYDILQSNFQNNFGYFAKYLLLRFLITSNNTVSFFSHESS